MSTQEIKERNAQKGCNQYERVDFGSYKKWRVKATTETFIFPKDFFQNISKTHMKNGLVNSWEKVVVGFRLIDLEQT